MNNSKIQVTELRFSQATPGDASRGLLGYLSFLLNGAFRIDGVTIRETRDRRMTLSFPSRRDRGGREHSLFFPVTDEARTALEKEIFEALAGVMNSRVRVNQR